jgi:CSLREA domain-containing protein
MQHPRLLPLLLSLLVLAACGEGQPTAPTPPAGPGNPAFSHTAGHKVVNSLADPGDGTCNVTQCTLREAINASGSTEISFAPGLTGAITLAKPSAGGGLLMIEKALTITGPSTGIVIRRRNTDPDFRIFRIGSGATVKLTNLTIRNGKTNLGGGGIVNFGTLTLTHCTVAGNSATQGAGGIDNHGPLTVTNSTIANNSGGGIANYARGTLTLTNSTVARNSRGGIGNSQGTLTVTNSTVVYNSGTGIGASGGTSTVTHTRIAHNSSTTYGGGILNAFGEFTLTNSTVALNSAAFGGGIANRILGTVRITGSTVVGNSATVAGGGMFNILGGFRRVSATLIVTNSTVSGNSAPAGGGIYNSAGGIGLTNSTVAFNSASQEGGGIHQIQEAQLRLTNSLVARNSAPTAPDVLASPDVESFVGALFSLIGNGSGSGITNTDGNQVGNVSPNSSPIDPKLGPLAENGGPTRTHALLLGSPAIDAASTPDCPTTDQRGVLRPQGAACDIGSYERE